MGITIILYYLILIELNILCIYNNLMVRYKSILIMLFIIQLKYVQMTVLIFAYIKHWCICLPKINIP